MTTDQLVAAAPRNIFLTLQWGDSSVSRYVVSDYDVEVSGNTHTALPVFEIEDIRLTGDLAPENITFRCASGDVAPLEDFVEQASHARIRCTFAVADPTNASATYREFFFGYLASASPTEQDDQELYEFEFTGIKAELNKRLGVIADNYCQVWLGHRLCTVDVAALQETGEITSLETDGIANRVTVDFGGSPPAYTDALWRTGVIELDGLSLGILASVGAGKFDLEFPPPASWLNATVTAEPGCDGLVSTCRDVYSNAANFVGYGLDMPDKSPLTEIA